MPLCSNNRSKGKLGITFYRFSVDKYAKESWIARIRGDVGKNFQVSDCGLRLQAKQALSLINLFKVILSTRIMCRAELLFYFVPMYFYCRNKTLQLFFRFQEAKMQRFARNILNHRQTFERPSLGYVYNLRKSSVPSVLCCTMPGTVPSPNNQQMQKELNLSSSFPEKVVRKSDGLKYSEQTFASRNLKNNCNVLLRAIKVQKQQLGSTHNSSRSNYFEQIDYR